MFGNFFQQMQMMQKLMKDENFRKLMAHPKVQELFKDPEFLKAAQAKDMTALSRNPRLEELKSDPDLRDILSKLDMGKLFG